LRYHPLLHYGGRPSGSLKDLFDCVFVLGSKMGVSAGRLKIRVAHVLRDREKWDATANQSRAARVPPCV